MTLISKILADKSNAAIKSGGADIKQGLVGRRVVPSQCRVLICKTNDHAVVIGGLSNDQLPRSEREDFTTGLFN